MLASGKVCFFCVGLTNFGILGCFGGLCHAAVNWFSRQSSGPSCEEGQGLLLQQCSSSSSSSGSKLIIIYNIKYLVVCGSSC